MNSNIKLINIGLTEKELKIISDSLNLYYENQHESFVFFSTRLSTTATNVLYSYVKDIESLYDKVSVLVRSCEE